MSGHSRRRFIKNAALAGVIPAVSVKNRTSKSQILHHVFFWLKNPGNKNDREKLIAGIRTLKAIPEISELYVGIPAATEKRPVVDNSYDVSEMLLLNSIADEKKYQEHPLHKKFVATCSGLWSKVQVYDMLTV